MSILDLLDRPIAYHRIFVTLTGSVKAAVLLSQALYWQKRAKQADGWWYKTAEEWQEETGLSKHEQNTARQDCEKYLKSDLRGVPATLYWKVDEDQLSQDLIDGKRETSLTESAKLDSLNTRNINRNTETTTETTPEIQPKISFDEEQADISWGIASGKPITDKALAKQKDKLEFENMLDKQLTRLGLNFSQFVEDDKDRFRKFIVAERERGRELSVFVDWWLADEFRRANTPWKLDPIRQQWLKAFVQAENKPSEDYTGGKSFHL